MTRTGVQLPIPGQVQWGDVFILQTATANVPYLFNGIGWVVLTTSPVVRLSPDLGGETSVGTGVSVITSIAVPASVLTAAGQIVKVRYWGHFAANNNNKQVALYLAGSPYSAMPTAAATSNAKNWTIDASIVLITVTAVSTVATTVVGDGTTDGLVYPYRVNGSTLNPANGFSVQIVNALAVSDGDILVDGGFVELLT